jgi:hypothetical protein
MGSLEREKGGEGRIEERVEGSQYLLRKKILNILHTLFYLILTANGKVSLFQIKKQKDVNFLSNFMQCVSGIVRI